MLAARLRQSNRSADGRVRTNAALRETQLRRFAPLDAAGNRILGLAMQRLGLTARAHDAVLRVARTIADREGRETIDSNHVAEAVQYRAMDRASGIV